MLRHSSPVVVLLLLTLGAAACRRGADLAPGVTADGILSLRPGMSYEAVVAAIGEPFTMEVELPLHKEGSGRRVPTRDPRVGRATLTYSRALGFTTTYPMLWVHLRSACVTEVYAKQYFALGPFGGDDERIYGHSEGEVPWGNPDVLRKAFGR